MVHFVPQHTGSNRSFFIFQSIRFHNTRINVTSCVPIRNVRPSMQPFARSRAVSAGLLYRISSKEERKFKKEGHIFIHALSKMRFSLRHFQETRHHSVILPGRVLQNFIQIGKTGQQFVMRSRYSSNAAAPYKEVLF